MGCLSSQEDTKYVSDASASTAPTAPAGTDSQGTKTPDANVDMNAKPNTNPDADTSSMKSQGTGTARPGTRRGLGTVPVPRRGGGGIGAGGDEDAPQDAQAMDPPGTGELAGSYGPASGSGSGSGSGSDIGSGGGDRLLSGIDGVSLVVGRGSRARSEHTAEPVISGVEQGGGYVEAMDVDTNAQGMFIVMFDDRYVDIFLLTSSHATPSPSSTCHRSSASN